MLHAVSSVMKVNPKSMKYGSSLRKTIETPSQAL